MTVVNVNGVDFDFASAAFLAVREAVQQHLEQYKFIPAAEARLIAKAMIPAVVIMEAGEMIVAYDREGPAAASIQAAGLGGTLAGAFYGGQLGVSVGSAIGPAGSAIFGTLFAFGGAILGESGVEYTLNNGLKIWGNLQDGVVQFGDDFAQAVGDAYDQYIEPVGDFEAFVNDNITDFLQNGGFQYRTFNFADTTEGQAAINAVLNNTTHTDSDRQRIKTMLLNRVDASCRRVNRTQ